MKNIYLYVGLPLRLIIAVILFIIVLVGAVVFEMINLFFPNDLSHFPIEDAFRGLCKYVFRGTTEGSSGDSGKKLDDTFVIY